MKSQIAIVLILASTSLMAQELDTPNNSSEFSRFSLGAYFSPDIAHGFFRKTDDTRASKSFLGSLNDLENPKFGYTTGISVAYQINPNLSIESGIETSDKGYKTDKVELIYGDFIDLRRGIVFTAQDKPVPTHARFIMHYQYIGVPIKLTYTAGQGKWKFISSIGVTAEYLLRASSTLIVDYENGKQNRTNKKSDLNYRSFNISPTISPGVDYQINQRMSLRAMPTFRVGVIPIIDEPITGYLYSGGLQFGWCMKL